MKAIKIENVRIILDSISAYSIVNDTILNIFLKGVYEPHEFEFQNKDLRDQIVKWLDKQFQSISLTDNNRF